MTCWYFGVLEPPTVGHYVYREGSRSWDAAAPLGLRGETLDMKHTPPEPQTQGLARLSALRRGAETVTILAWWDRTGDRRGNSNSALIVDRECTLAEMLAEGARAFPAVMARQTVTPYVGKAAPYYWAHCGVPYKPSGNWWVCMICGERAPGESSQPKRLSVPPNPPESHVAKLIVDKGPNRG